MSHFGAAFTPIRWFDLDFCLPTPPDFSTSPSPSPSLSFRILDLFFPLFIHFYNSPSPSLPLSSLHFYFLHFFQTFSCPSAAPSILKHRPPFSLSLSLIFLTWPFLQRSHLTFSFFLLSYLFFPFFPYRHFLFSPFSVPQPLAIPPSTLFLSILLCHLPSNLFFSFIRLSPLHFPLFFQARPSPSLSASLSCRWAI